MTVKNVVENKEKYEVELTVEVGKEEFEAALDRVYRKSRGSIQVPGFRKGKAPRKVIEGMYGAGVFYEDAVEDIYPSACEAAIKEQGLDSVAPPMVEITELSKDGFTFKATITVRPTVELKQYKGLEADKVLPTVTEEAVDNELKMYVDRATQLVSVDRAAEMGDTAVIDYVGLKDGVAFDGGTANGYELTLGSHTFIPGFEEQVVGMKAGDEKDLDISFPEDYHAEDLAGKPVVFKVKCVDVKVKQVPEIDDEFAKDVSEFETMAEFRADLKEKIIDREMSQSEAKFRQALLTQLCDQIDIELPEGMVKAQTDTLLNNYAARLEQQGITMEMYMSYMKTSEEQIRGELQETAVLQIKQQLALDAVAAAEGITVSNEDVEEEIKKAAANLNVPYERIIEGLDYEGLKADLARDRAMDAVAIAAKPHMITAEAVNGEIELTEVTKEEKPKKKAAAKKTTKKADAAEGEEKPAAKKTAAKKTTTKKKADAAEGEEKPAAKKTAAKKTTAKKKTDAAEGEEKPAAKKTAAKKTTTKKKADEKKTEE